MHRYGVKEAMAEAAPIMQMMMPLSLMSTLMKTVKGGLMFQQPELNSEARYMKDAKRDEWLAKGYRPGLVEMGLRWAEGWVKRNPFFRQLTRADQQRYYHIFLRDGLEGAESYVRRMSEAVV